MSEELQENTEAQTEEVLTGESEQPQETQTERPDWLPEKFDRPEELANSYQELERAFYTRKEELRNQIVHDYAHHDLNTLFVDALDFTPHVLKTIESTEQYCKNLFEKEPK